MRHLPILETVAWVKPGQDFVSIGKRFSHWIHSILLNGERKSVFPVQPFRAIRIRATVSSSEEILVLGTSGTLKFRWVKHLPWECLPKREISFAIDQYPEKLSDRRPTLIT